MKQKKKTADEKLMFNEKNVAKYLASNPVSPSAWLTPGEIIRLLQALPTPFVEREVEALVKWGELAKIQQTLLALALDGLIRVGRFDHGNPHWLTKCKVEDLPAKYGVPPNLDPPSNN